MDRKHIAVLTCRNKSSRLYAKPLQNLDIESGLTVLDYMIQWMRTVDCYHEIVLAIAEGIENQVYIESASEYGVPYFVGEEEDVLNRVIACTEAFDGTDVTRFGTESPFTYFEIVEEAWEKHVAGNWDATFLDNVPDGSGIEIFTLEALRESHRNGNQKHQTQGCGLYIRENKGKFNIQNIEAPQKIKRTDIRLTIDYPEDLVLCRAVYKHFEDKMPRIPLAEIIGFLDQTPSLKALVDPFVDEGLKTMYL
jgi:spore coat polysaccharide biosynthesis protein SpsF